MKQKCLYALGLALFSAAAAFPQVALNTTPSRIVGHPNPEQLAPLASVNPNLVEGRELFAPQGLALDTTASPAILYVSDTANNRVLAWKNARSFTNGQKADLVIGQTDFFSTNPLGPGTAFSTGLNAPTGLTVDSKGNLYVVDSGNNRVLRFPKPFSQQSVTPDLVIGQTAFQYNYVNGSSSGALSAKGFSIKGAVAGIAVSPVTGDLYVADPGNRRVLGFRGGDLGSNGPSASVVLGQSTFTGTDSSLNPNDPKSQQVTYQFAVPCGIVFDSKGRMYVTDADPNASADTTSLTGRVLVFSNLTTRASADRIYGVFPLGYAPTQDQIGRVTMIGPTAVFLLPDGSTGVVDSNSNRILIFPGVDNWPTDNTAPLAIQSANGPLGLIGQTDFTTRGANRSTSSSVITPPASATTLWAPIAAVFYNNELYISDSSNSRVLVMSYSAGPTFSAATRWLGQDRADTNTANLIEGREFRFFGDAGLAVDNNNGGVPHLYVADPYNHRVLGFKDLRTLKAGASADIVIGQPDLKTALCNYNPYNPAASGDLTKPNDAGLCFPVGLAVDSKGNLYVADNLNGRVLRFPAPFAQSGLPHADLVLGKQSFTDTISDPSSRTLYRPYGLAFSGLTGLVVTDTSYNRVTYYPFTANGTFTAGTDNGLAASVVFGQSTVSGTSSGATSDALNSPHHVGCDTSGRVYVVDTGNNRVQIFGDPNSSYTQRTGATAVYSVSGLNSPRGVYVSQITGEFWVTNTNSGTTLKYPQFDTLRVGNGQPTAIAYAASNTIAVAQDSFNDLFVADASNRVAIHFPALAAINGANFLTTQALAPGTLASVCAINSNFCQDHTVYQFGLTSASADTTKLPLPTSLNDVQVMFNGTAVPLYYVSPFQINFVVPWSAPTSGTAEVLVMQPSTGRIYAAGSVSVNTASPGILMFDYNGSLRRAVVQNFKSDGTVETNDAAHPAPRGSTIIVWATGGGMVTSPPADGSVPSGAIWTTSMPRVAIGSQFVDAASPLLPGDPTDGKFVTFSGLSPQFPGVWQINVKVPMSTVAGSQVPIGITMNDINSADPSQFRLTIAVQ